MKIDYLLLTIVPNDQPEPVVPATPVTTPQTDKSKKADDETKAKVKKDNKTVRFHLLKHMMNSLFDICVKQKYAKDICNILETGYGADNDGGNKYVVGKWLQFQIVDSKPIMDQVHEYKNMAADVFTEGIKMCDILRANVLLEIFSPFWSDYRNNLKLKKKKKI